MRFKPLVIALLLLSLGLGFAIWRRPVKEVARPEVYSSIFENKFHCTLYYTPRQAGFSGARGFDMTLETRSGLKEQKYPRDFLLAVEKEGFGRLSNPFQGKGYLRYWSGEWSFADQPIDHLQRPLIAKSSCAISGKQKQLTPDLVLKIRALNAPADFSELSWKAADTGSGLEEWQIDLYWGEDDPLGPAKQLSRPKSGVFDLSGVTVCVCK
jgi:hypothetical protein